MRILFLRMPDKCLSLRANQLPMWLPQAILRPVEKLCPARRTVAGGDTDFYNSYHACQSCQDLAARISCLITRATLNEAGKSDEELIDPMQRLELKIPPLALVLLAGGVMWVIAWAVPTFGFVFPARRICAMGAVLIGTAVAGMGIFSFRRARTTVNPMKPDSSSALVVTGIYRLTRNPMYLGFLWILLGWGIFLSNAPAFLVLPGFVLYMNRFQIEPEERALTRLFGRAFVTYATQVRRWI
ncbi:MAG: isoprenylcysteine carboxylmethyltransferase family protein [Sphingobium sp.]|nr:isoprenylcysteine carboxylmethyltransferase family protein [Sphingobium sp.]